MATIMMQNTTIRSIAFAAGIALLALAAPASRAIAADGSWNINNAGNWSTAGSWLSNSIPGSTSSTTSTDIATFGFTLTAGRVVTVDANRNIAGIIFSNTSAFGYTLSSGNLLLSNGGVIQSATNNGAHIDTISSAIAIQGDSGSGTFTAGATSASSRLSIGAVTGVSTAGNTTTLTLNGDNTGANAVTGVIGNGSAGGTLAVVKSGNGVWVLSGANTFTGGVTLNSGTLRLGNNAALGSGTFTIAGGAIDVTSARTTTNNNAQAWNGDFTYVGTNTLNLCTGAVAMNASRTVTVNASTLTVGGVISGAGFGLTKSGAGNLTLSAANTFTGPVTINSGTLTVKSAIGNGGSAGGLGQSTSDAANLVINGGVFNWNAAASETSNRSITIGTNGGTFSSFGISGAAGLTLTGSLALAGSGARTITLISAASNRNNSWSADIGDSGGATSVVVNNTFANGGSSWALSGSLSFTGGLSVTGGGGVLNLTGTNNNFSGGVTVGAGSALYLNRTGTLSQDFTNNGTVGSGQNSTSVTFSGVISGAGNVTSTGNARSITLSNTNNSYEGTTKVQ